MNSIRSLAFVLAASVIAAASAGAQTVITSVPYMISSAGHYRLGSSLSSTGSALITIASSNVDLDLGDFTIQGSGGQTTPIGIYATDVQNIRVHNGRVAGAQSGIYFLRVQRAVIENVTIDTCDTVGIQCVYPSLGTVIRNNAVSLADSTSKATSCIATQGGVRIENNTLVGKTAGGYGVEANASDLILGNTVFNCQYGIARGKYLNNLTSGCTTPFTGGVNATGNN